MMEQIRPKIVIEGQTLEVEERQAIVLPCLVDHLGIVCLIIAELDNPTLDQLLNFVCSGLINRFSGVRASPVESS